MHMQPCTCDSDHQKKKRSEQLLQYSASDDDSVIRAAELLKLETYWVKTFSTLAKSFHSLISSDYCRCLSLCSLLNTDCAIPPPPRPLLCCYCTACSCSTSNDSDRPIKASDVSASGLWRTGSRLPPCTAEELRRAVYQTASKITLRSIKGGF